MDNKLKLYIERVVREELDVVSESAGKEPTKKQIDATFELLRQSITHSQFAGKVFVAGGAVRDMVMGLDPKDIDLVVELEDGGIRFAKFLASRLGIYRGASNPLLFPDFGTAKLALDGVVHNGVSLDGVDVEVVNTRQEEYDQDSRKPTTRHGTIKQDVFRRDLTINSLLMDIMSGEIVDLTGKGRDDIAKGVIQTPSEPDRIFKDDPLRLMRAVRFGGRYNFKTPDFMTASIKKNADQLKRISRERVREELEKILSGANPDVGVGMLFDMGLMPYIIPQIADNKEATVAAAKSGKGPMGKLILMLKGIAPPVVVKALRSLKFSNADVDVMEKVVAAMQLIDRERTSASILKAGTDLVKAGLPGYVDFLRPLDKQVQQLEPFFTKGPVVHVTPPEFMQRFNVKPGPLVGKMVQLQKEMWYENPRVTKEEVLERIENEL
jgi:poly(A) polymerase